MSPSPDSDGVSTARTTAADDLRLGGALRRNSSGRPAACRIHEQGVYGHAI